MSALVLGAERLIGNAIARSLARKHELVLACRDSTALDRLVRWPHSGREAEGDRPGDSRPEFDVVIAVKAEGDRGLVGRRCDDCDCRGGVRLSCADHDSA